MLAWSMIAFAEIVSFAAACSLTRNSFLSMAVSPCVRATGVVPPLRRARRRSFSVVAAAAARPRVVGIAGMFRLKLPMPMADTM